MGLRAAAVLVLLTAPTILFVRAEERMGETVVAREGVLAVIVNKENSTGDLKLSTVRRIFLSEQRHWSHGKKITVAMLERGQLERSAAHRLIFGMNESAYSRILLKREYTSDPPLAAPELVATSTVMKKFVAYVPGSIGYIWADEMDDTIKAIKIDGVDPGAAAYKLRIVLK